MDERKYPCVLQDFVHFGAAAQKVDFRPDRAGFRFESADFRSRRAGFMPKKADYRLHWVDLWSRQAGLTLLAWGDVRTDECTDVQMDEQTYGNSTLCSIGHLALWGFCPKSI